jgi:hypothetical protein
MEDYAIGIRIDIAKIVALRARNPSGPQHMSVLRSRVRKEAALFQEPLVSSSAVGTLSFNYSVLSITSTCVRMMGYPFSP